MGQSPPLRTKSGEGPVMKNIPDRDFLQVRDEENHLYKHQTHQHYLLSRDAVFYLVGMATSVRAPFPALKYKSTRFLRCWSNDTRSACGFVPYLLQLSIRWRLQDSVDKQGLKNSDQCGSDGPLAVGLRLRSHDREEAIPINGNLNWDSSSFFCIRIATWSEWSKKIRRGLCCSELAVHSMISLGFPIRCKALKKYMLIDPYVKTRSRCSTNLGARDIATT
jgi:hypothetical protein